MAEWNKFVYKTSIDKDNYIIRDHKVHDVAIMPGVTFLDMIFRCLYNKGFATDNITIQNILFLEPISILGNEVKEIRITITESEDGTLGTILAESALESEETNREWKVNLKAEVDFHNKVEIEPINVSELIGQAFEMVDLDESYAFAREMHINHDEFMKALGKMYLGDGYILAEVTLSNLAMEYLEDFFLHPVYLDSSTIVPGYRYDKLEQKYEPAIPIYIENFYAGSRLTEKKYYVYIDTNKCGFDSIDIIHTSIVLYSEDGIGKVYIDKLKSKRIRSQKDLVVQNKTEKENRIDTEEVKALESSDAFYTKEIIVAQLRALIVKFAGIEESSIRNESDFYDIGLESVGLIQMVREMEKLYDEKFYPTLLFEYMNIEELSGYLYERLKNKKFINSSSEKKEDKLSKQINHEVYLYEVKPFLEDTQISLKNAISIPNEEFTCEDRNSDEIFQMLYHYEVKGELSDCINYRLDKMNFDANKKYANAKAIISYCQGYSKLKNHRKLHLVVTGNENQFGENHDLEALSGLLKTVESENPLIQTSLLIGSQDEKLYKNYYQKIESTYEKKIPYKNNGVYIITGGMGGVGKMFARRIASLFHATILLLGHSSLSAEKHEFIQEIEKMGSICIYIQVDMTDKDAVYKTAKEIEKKYIFINGIIHCAGVLKDMVINDMNFEDFNLVCDTKINGFIGLDEAYAAQKLDFFVTFSSITALTGNIGQSSYAYANSYMDSLMKTRAREEKEGTRFGRSVSINWTLWANGGMESTNDVVEQMEEQYHMGPLQDEDGIHAFEQVLASSANQVLVYYGEEDSLRELGLESNPPEKGNNENEVTETKTESKSKVKDIAIIGLAGQYPMADDVDEYWKNLLEGKNCIQEIPKDRWDAEEYFNSNKNQKGTAYSKWGGFINNPATFDPMFFHITPKEAELMDPQERLFLECAWNTVEDAGYTKKQLGKKVGVFVGVMWGQYQLCGIDELNKGNVVTPSSFFASIANRVSYWFDFTGPSMAVDTMCSSSLTTIHLACKSILEHECETAIAGGVNIMLHPSKYLFLSANKMCSSDGRCRAFGEGGDGYVPGEGIGAVLLKPLEKAIEDKDYIYGVIKGSSLNHGGKTSGYSVPNPKAQAKVIKDAYDRASIELETVSYLEAHGTGTSLGDPIEIDGLSKVFTDFKKQGKMCDIGSVKSNIGHLESAAGIAGVTKILLQMKHHKLVPSLHAEVLNTNIDFEHSPFNVVTKVKEWNPENEQDNLCAGISSFGAGGSNAHVIIEEYKNKFVDILKEVSQTTKLFVLSARTKENLTDYLRKYETFLLEKGDTVSLNQLTYIHQEKREHMEYRVAFLIKTVSELQQYIKEAVLGKNNEELLKAYKDDALYEKATDYVYGKNVDFTQLWNETYSNIPLPTYPFSKKEYWMPTVNKNNMQANIHPLITRNVSTLHEQCFETVFTGKEYFIKDHVVSGKMTVPGAVLLEMAKTACELSDGRKVKCIKDLVWKKTVTLEHTNSECRLSISVFIQNGEVLFQIDNHIENEKVRVSTGKCEFYLSAENENVEQKQIDVKAVLSGAGEEVEPSVAYDKFKQANICYGEIFQALKKIVVKERKAVSFAKIEKKGKDGLADCKVHPLLIDAAFQSICAFTVKQSVEQYLPYSIGKITFYHSCPEEAYIYSKVIAEDDKSKCYYLALCDSEGNVATEIETFKVLKISNPKELVLYGREEIENTLQYENLSLQTRKNVLLIDENEKLHSFFIEQGYHVITLKEGSAFNQRNEESYEVDFWSKDSMKQLCESLAEAKCVPDILIYGLEKEKKEAELSSYFAIIQTFLTWKELNELKCIYYYKLDVENERENSLRAAIEGFHKSVNQEQNKLEGKVVAFDEIEYAALLGEVKEDVYSSFVTYKKSKRYISRYVERKLKKSEPSYAGKTILISGGTGGLGFLFAKYFAGFKDVTIILCGRSSLTDKKKEKIENLRENGTKVIYKQADICDKENVADMVKQLKAEIGTIHGVVHCAGVLHDKLLRGKSWEDFRSTLEPKVAGLTNLDEVLGDEPLEFFASFSSLASVTGSVGQTDYSYANGYLDHFMAERRKMVQQKKRFGRSLSINWPLWSHGGMQMEESNLRLMKNTTGIDLLDERTGVKAFPYAFSLEEAQVVVLSGNGKKIREYFKAKEKENKSRDISLSTDEKTSLYSYIEQYIVQLIAKEIKVSADFLSVKEPFEKYGIDSIAIMNMTASLEEVLGTISKTLFFEYNTVRQISNYFLEHYAGEFAQEFGKETEEKDSDSYVPEITEQKYERFYLEDDIKAQESEVDDIAIIGLSGQYPLGDSVEEFWDNLKQGRNCITDIPKERWDNGLIYEKEKGVQGKSYGIRGGFLHDIDKFDAMLFHIAPKEAEMIDPQERLFLQNVWTALEDSGYNEESLKKNKVGVFVGVMYGQYQLLGLDASTQDNIIAPNSSFSSISNRVSFFYDFKGPSMAVDTMCSSSLSALHLACLSIQKKECNMAVVGGVNTCVHPMKYVQLSQGKFLSEDGLCKAFGADGNGYVPGEGVGAVILKPLHMAEKDHDHIYGVIKATALNHGGKTNGYTVPNPNQQAEVIKTALEKAGIDGSWISYVEAHGTGTSLGDPIEIKGLSQTVGVGKGIHSCPVGSVKSNIGHLESCAGMASITKVLLQLKYKKLVPSIHAEKLNPNIDFEHSPFYVQRELEEWKQPVKRINGEETAIPRCAGISAFGAGGSNAHVIISEYVSEKHTGQTAGKHFFILSARTKERLAVFAQKIKEYVEQNKKEISLDNLAYTMQVGKNYLDERAVILCDTCEELIEELKNLSDQTPSENIYCGNRKNYTKYLREHGQKDEAGYLNKFILDKNLEQLAELWVNGFDICWEEFYQYESEKPYRLSLPTYPFEKNSYWIQKPDNTRYISGKSEEYELVDKNCSTIQEVRFLKWLNGDVDYINHHMIQNKLVVPGAVFMEMALEAGTLAVEQPVTGLTNVLFQKELIVTENENAYISFMPCNNGNLAFEIWEEKNNYVCAEGECLYEAWNLVDSIDLRQKRSMCKNYITGQELYAQFKKGGFYYGERYKNIEEAWYSEDLVIAHFKMDVQNRKYIMNPSLIDTAFQSVSLFVQSESGYLPYAVDTFKFYETECTEGYLLAEKKTSKKEGELSYDITAVTEKGSILFEIEDFMLKQSISMKEANSYDTVWLSKDWITAPIEKQAEDSENGIVVFTVSETISDLVSDNKNVIQVYNGDGFYKVSRTKYQINLLDCNAYEKCIEEVRKDFLHITSVVYRFDDLYENNHLTVMEQLENSILPVVAFMKAHGSKMNSNPLNLLVQSGARNCMEDSFIQAFDGFLKTLHLEYPKVGFKLVECNTYETCLQEMGLPFDGYEHIKYENGARYKEIMTVQSKTGVHSHSLAIAPNQTFIITGGMGGLGFLFAKYLVQEKGCNVALIGRRTLNDQMEKQLKELDPSGEKVLYTAADLVCYEALQHAIEEAKSRFGFIHGVIHAAGVLNDCLLGKKSIEEFYKVIKPKVLGAVWLDELTREEPIQLFSVFSSSSSILGNLGQSDYAYANSFMDSYIRFRQKWADVEDSKRKYVSINWPLWKDGGMQVEENTEKMLKEAAGLVSLPETDGIQIFEQCISQNTANAMFLYGFKNKIIKLIQRDDKAETEEKNENVVVSKEENQKVIYLIIETICELLKVNRSDVFLDTEFSELGFDSISYSDFSNQLNVKMNLNLTPNLFFEYTNVDALADYLIQECGCLSKKEEKGQKPLNKTVSIKTVLEENKRIKKHTVSSLKMERTVASNTIQNQSTDFNVGKEDIAIIGMSGKMPQSDDLNEFWKNLIDNKNMIMKIPEDRWSIDDYYGNPQEDENKTNVIYGGFMNDIQSFDAEFFGILPKEAELMDPQQRVFLETVWKTVEDAGYRMSDLNDSDTGLFVGVAASDYEKVLNKNNIDITAQSSTGMSHSILANRISYLFNWHGPSEPIDTACSSSLVAIHHAIHSIWIGDCSMAVAGGVNVMLDPDLYVSFNKAGMLSEDGKCKTFDEAANGYVRGEGVGAVLLKPLSKAIKDKNHIYAVIKSSVVNHGGRANSLTSPNPNAQAKLIAQAYKEAQVDINTVSYIEAHGTGTSLGDPIEINGLKKAFHMFSEDSGTALQKHFCGIGSVKTNIGHLETAAGMAGLFKILLGMKNRKIPANLHFHKLNSYISLENSPFYIMDKNMEWEAKKGENEIDIPRRAGISSFGYGGVNAHLVLEEYVELNKEKDMVKPQIIVLSAKTKESLDKQISNFYDFCTENIEKFENRGFLEEVSYTLQVGREAFAQKNSFVAESYDELLLKLKKLLNQEMEGDIYCSQDAVNALTGILSKKESDLLVQNMLDEEEYDKIARLWINGFFIPWDTLHNGVIQKVSLPSYSFQKDSFWVKKKQRRQETTSVEGVSLGKMINSVELGKSYEDGIAFTAKLTKSQPVIAHHVVNNARVFAGMGYIEVALEALNSIGMKKSIVLKDVLFRQMLCVEEEVEIRIWLTKHENQNQFKITDVGYQDIYTSGNVAVRETEPAAEYVNTENFAFTNSLAGKQLYQRFFENGMEYGPMFQGITKVSWNDEEALSCMQLNSEYVSDFEEFVLHPAIMDAALQTISVLWTNEDANVAVVPYRIHTIEIRQSISAKAYAYVKKEDDEIYNIVLLNENKEVCVVFCGVCLKEIHSDTKKHNICYVPVWKPISK